MVLFQKKNIETSINDIQEIHVHITRFMELAKIGLVQAYFITRKWIPSKRKLPSRGFK